MASRVTGLFAILFALAGCRADGTAPGGAPIQRTFDFSRGVADWAIGQADNAPATAPTEVIGEARLLPAPLTGSGLLLSGTNCRDGLFLQAPTRVPDLPPGQRIGPRPPWNWRDHDHRWPPNDRYGKAVYFAFGRALGWMEMPPGSGLVQLIDVHGTGAQRAHVSPRWERSSKPGQFR